MKFCAILALLGSLVLSEKAFSYPSSVNVSSPMISSAGANAGRRFFDGDTASSLGCSFGAAPSPQTCYKGSLAGFNPSGSMCKYWTYICRDGKPAQDLIDQAEADHNTKLAQRQLRPVFENERAAYWGYINTTARSPNAGRGNSALAKLDACVNYTKADSYVQTGGQIAWNTCNSDCDTAQNGYCNDTGSNNGQSGVTSAACKDRCDCALGLYNGATCEGL